MAAITITVSCGHCGSVIVTPVTPTAVALVNRCGACGRSGRLRVLDGGVTSPPVIAPDAGHPSVPLPPDTGL